MARPYDYFDYLVRIHIDPMKRYAAGVIQRGLCFFERQKAPQFLKDTHRQ